MPGRWGNQTFHRPTVRKRCGLEGVYTGRLLMMTSILLVFVSMNVKNVSSQSTVNRSIFIMYRKRSFGLRHYIDQNGQLIPC